MKLKKIHVDNPSKKRNTVQWVAMGPDNIPLVKLYGTRKPFAVKRLLANGDTNTKLAKDYGKEYLTKGLSMSPADASGFFNTCLMASEGCAQSCLHHQGMASVWESIEQARNCKTAVWAIFRDWTIETLDRELHNATLWADRKNKALGVRLNVLSDNPYERYGIVDNHKRVQFWDYTKYPKRAGQLRPNYWLTFSRSETNNAQALEILESGNNVAVVFADMEFARVANKANLQTLPNTWEGFEVIDGNNTDLRFLDPKGVVVGLTLKAHSYAMRELALKSGFAVQHYRGQYGIGPFRHAA